MNANAKIEWYLAREGQQHGPLSEDEMQSFIDLSHLKPTDLVWRAGFPEWIMASEVFRNDPPDPPPPSHLPSDLKSSVYAPEPSKPKSVLDVAREWLRKEAAEVGYPPPEAPQPRSLREVLEEHARQQAVADELPPEPPQPKERTGSQKIFVSYSKNDRDAVEKFASDLTNRGYDVWWDVSLIPGNSFRLEIDRRLNEASAVIVVWSENALESLWVQAEADHAVSQGKLINAHVPDFDASKIIKPFNMLHSVSITDGQSSIAQKIDELTS